MALVKFGGGVIQMSGSIAGNTFARNRSGNYARAKTKPVNPNTDRQAQVRAAIAFLVNRWSQTLTLAQRTAWNLYADNVNMKNRLGETIQLSGFNHYIRSNSWLAARGLPTIDPGPVIFELPTHDPAFAITCSEATQQITFTYNSTLPWATEDDSFIQFFQGSPQNHQRNFFAGPWRYCSAVGGVLGAPVASPHVVASVFAMAEGQRQWVYARIMRADARLSEVFRADTFCAA